MRPIPLSPLASAFVLALLALLPGACNRKDSTSTTQPADGGGGAQHSGMRDIAQNPAILLDRDVQVAELTLHGVKLGDPAPADVTGEPDPSGWVGFKGHQDVLRLQEGKVAAISFSDAATLSKLGVQSEEDLFARLGKAEDSISAGEDAPEAFHVFKNGAMTVWFDRKAKQVTRVNLGS